jgi:hypothetical protein
MDDRQEGDYEIITATSKEDAEIDILQARYFVVAVSAWLQEGDWL